MNARKIILWLVILIVGANLALMVVVLRGTMAPPPASLYLPKPNGHDDFVRAGKILTTKPEDYKELTIPQLRTIVAGNDVALDIVRTGMTRECLVPLDDLKWNQDEHVAELNSFKAMATAFSADASLAELERRTNDAAGILLELVRFSHAFCRGGASVDEGLGEQVESLGLGRLVKLRDSLDANTCAHVAKTLEEVDGQSDSLEQIVSRNISYTGQLTFHQSLSRLIHFRRVRIANNFFATKFKEQAKQRREVMVAFAAHAFQLAKGKPPASLADLVPDYLKAVPQDPLTGMNLEYKP